MEEPGVTFGPSAEAESELKARFSPGDHQLPDKEAEGWKTTTQRFPVQPELLPVHNTTKSKRSVNTSATA